MRDPLAELARLRRLEVVQARKQLAGRTAGLAAAEARHQAAVAAPLREAASAESADYAAWLPSALAERERASLAERHSAGMAEMARDALTLARIAERQVEMLREEHSRAAALRGRRKAQAVLDECAGRQ